MSEKIDGLVVAGWNRVYPVVQIINTCKFYDIQNVACIDLDSPSRRLFWLNSNKTYLPYIETHLIDSCNLNCKNCAHYANLFNDGDIYEIEDFRRDIRQIADNVDLVVFRMMGGEPLKLKNLDQYIKIARQCLPEANLRIVTNGLLVPSTPQKIFDSIRENDVCVDVSVYKPTMKIYDKITEKFVKNNIFYRMENKPIEYFTKVRTLNGKHDADISRSNCNGDICRILRDGKIYKCALDAMGFKLAEHFGIKNFPAATGVDIYAKNFSLLLEKLDGNIESCFWCNEMPEKVEWEAGGKPLLSDFIIDKK